VTHYHVNKTIILRGERSAKIGNMELSAVRSAYTVHSTAASWRCQKPGIQFVSHMRHFQLCIGLVDREVKIVNVADAMHARCATSLTRSVSSFAIKCWS